MEGGIRLSRDEVDYEKQGIELQRRLMSIPVCRRETILNSRIVFLNQSTFFVLSLDGDIFSNFLLFPRQKSVLLTESFFIKSIYVYIKLC